MNNVIQQPRQTTKAGLIDKFEKRTAELRERVETIERCEEGLQQVLRQHGFKDINAYWNEKADIMAALTGGKPRRVPFKHQRRTPEIDKEILRRSKLGQGSGRIANELNLSQSTVCNVRKMFRDQRLLDS